MNIEITITPYVWLQVPPETRNALAKEFDIKCTGTPRCITELGNTRVESDGFTIDDLRVLTVERMTEWLKKRGVNYQSTDINYLFGLCVDEIMGKKTVQGTETETKEFIEPKKRFCDFCDSKGVKHLKTCPKYKSNKTI